MTPERWQQVKRVCDRALECAPSERDAFVEQECRDDPDLLHDVKTLLVHTADGTDVLQAPVWQRVDTPGWLPETVGRYRVLRLIGEGGMGSVYEAEQDHPRRVVALKVIRFGLPTREALHRFEREAQALGRLQHQGIAQIYEAGTADTGLGPQPYFAMEFIRGESLTDYAASHRLDLRQRLELVARICDAIAHAHERGLIHRDLKPSNILVDQSGQPKILDFGVARLTDEPARPTVQTDVGQLVGTLAYMSPEQVLAEPLELDARSDVYALGIILYELLAGRLPYRVGTRVHEAVQTIRDEDPARLSAVNRTYRGDVETIVAKALEKDKTRRYQSAAALAEDIRRYLSHQPITARPASASYQLQKFARRHKSLVAATAVTFAALVAGIAVSAWEAVKARRAERTAEAVSSFLQDDLLAQASASMQASPNRKADPDLKVRTALDRAAARVAVKFAGQPEVEAAIRFTIGRTYAALGLYPEGRTQLERALELQRRTLGAENPKTLLTLYGLGATTFLQGKYPEAEALLTQTVDAQRRVLGPDHPDTLQTIGQLGNVYYWQAKYAKSATLLSENLEARRRVFGPDSAETNKVAGGLASAYHMLGKYAEAESLFRGVVEADRRLLGPEHPDTLGALNNQALNFESMGKYAEAEAIDTEVLATRRRVMGPEHPDTLAMMVNLANVYRDQNKRRDAQGLYLQALEAQRRVLGPEHLMTVRSMNNLATVYNEDGNFHQAEELYSEALQIDRRVFGMEHSETLICMANLASAYGWQGKYESAESLFGQALETVQRTLGPENPLTLAIAANFAYTQQREGKYALAETAVARILAVRRRILGAENPVTMDSVADLALAYVSQAKFDLGEPLAREAWEWNKKAQPDDWARFRAESLLGASLAGQHKYPEAEPLLLSGFEGMDHRKDDAGPQNYYHSDRAREWIVRLYEAWGKPDAAARWRARR